MRVRLALSFLGLSLCPGCALVQDGSRNLIISAARPFEEALECSRNRKWAQAALDEVCATEPHSEDYGRGFIKGYADFLFKGGDGTPPLVAPPRYRGICYQTPEGHRAVEDWFAGYRHGASSARDSGQRQWILAASSLHVPVAPPQDDPEIGVEPQAQPVPPQPVPTSPSEQALKKLSERPALSTPPAPPATAPRDLRNLLIRAAASYSSPRDAEQGAQGAQSPLNAKLGRPQ